MIFKIPEIRRDFRKILINVDQEFRDALRRFPDENYLVNVKMRTLKCKGTAGWPNVGQKAFALLADVQINKSEEAEHEDDREEDRNEKCDRLDQLIDQVGDLLGDRVD